MIKEKIYITLKFDLMVKRIFGNDKDKEPIKKLIKEILNIETDKIKILNSEMIGIPYKDKRIIVDLIVELEDKTIIAIEINTNVDDEIIKRNIYYMCKNISKDLGPNESYTKIKRHIQINFDFEGKHKSGIERYTLYDKNIKKELSDVIEIIRIDVPYYTKKCYTNNIENLDSLTKFIGLFGVKTREEAKRLCEGDECMEKIYKKIDELNEDEDVIGAYDYELDKKRLAIGQRELGIEEGMKKGLKKGMKEALNNTVLNMLKENTPVDFISKVTGLSTLEINKLSLK